MAFRILRRLRELQDVDTSGATPGDRLVLDADGETWVPHTVSAGATDAMDVAFTPAGTISSTNVQDAIEEVAAEAGGGSVAASAVTVTPAGGISSTDAQAALQELDSEKAATSHVHDGADITTGTVADARIASTIARDSEVTSAVAAEATARDSAITSAITTHEGASDPHPGYTTAAELAAYAQPIDSDLTAIAALSTTSFGRGLLALADAAALRTAGGVVIGTDVEAHDPDLTTIAGLSPTNDDILQRKSGAWANRTLAQLLADLDLGSLYQPLDSDLTAFAALAIAADKLPYGSGSHALSLADFTAFARTLLDDADASTFLSTLGVSTFIKTLLDDADAATARATLGITSGGLTQICDLTLGSAQASFDTNTILGGNISGSYSALEYQLQGACDAGSVQQVHIQLNNDSGSNYDRQQIAGSNTSITGEQSLGAVSARVGTIPGTDRVTGGNGLITGDIPNYAGTVFHKGGTSACMLIYTGTPTYELEELGFRYRSTSAITRMKLFVNGGSNFITGTRFTLWGKP